MSASEDQPLWFKFQWMNEKGEGVGLLRKKGAFNGDVLKLADVEVPARVILDVIVRDARLVVSSPSQEGPLNSIGVVLTSKRIAARPKEGLDLARSRAWGEQHRTHLANKGLGHLYRDVECANCRAVINLSRISLSPQVYCPFCHILTSGDGVESAVAEARHYRLCDDCGMFSKPRKFTIFYFYFLIVFYGWRTSTVWRCSTCKRRDAWKMLWGNLPFVLGVPIAITQLARSYMGDLAGGSFAGLHAGNRAAREGKFSDAIEKYRTILDRQGHAAGVKYNLGLALLQQGDRRRAAETFRLALEDCANYGPAYRQLRAIYEQLGEREKLIELKGIWEETEEFVEDAAIAS